MTPRRLVAGTGWKMNHGASAARAYGEVLARLLGGRAVTDIDAFVLPPFTTLHAAGPALAGTGIAMGGQNMHWEEDGAWTGEISAAMLKEAGCTYVELAHSERLQHFGETYERVALKVDLALAHGLTPILCLGETAEDKRLGRADAVLAGQLATALAGQPAAAVPSVILAYEPRWAIGAGEAASPDHVARRHGALRALIAERCGEDLAQRTRIIYGGSVTTGNGADIIAIPEVDGLFVGRAAWTAEGFAAILAIVGRAAIEKGHVS